MASSLESHDPFHKTKSCVKGRKDKFHNHVSYTCTIMKWEVLVLWIDLMSVITQVNGVKSGIGLFSSVINLSVIAAWRLHCKINQEKLSHFQFQSQITLWLLKAGLNHVRRPEFARSLSEDIRSNGMGHTLGSITLRRCKVCRKNIKIMCKKCNVWLYAKKAML